MDNLQFLEIIPKKYEKIKKKDYKFDIIKVA
jgi:hypothetical protein